MMLTTSTKRHSAVWADSSPWARGLLSEPQEGDSIRHSLRGSTRNHLWGLPLKTSRHGLSVEHEDIRGARASTDPYE
jgi:hypothetical protein